jgi:hypothetical protein
LLVITPGIKAVVTVSELFGFTMTYEAERFPMASLVR